jgi:hypothetical protein
VDKDLFLFLAKRLGILYYLVVILAWLFGPLDFMWMVILVVLGAFVGGTFWQIANGSYKRNKPKAASISQTPPPPDYQPPATQWPPTQAIPPQTDPYRSDSGPNQ